MEGSLRWPGSGRKKAQSEAIYDGRRDYSKHCWSMKEWLLELGKCAGIVGLFSCFFYRSVWAVIPLSALGVMLFRKDCRRKAAKDKNALLRQFGDLIQAVAANMRAGYSVENGFSECWQDMCRMHGEASYICRELNVIKQGLAMNITLEELLSDLGRRSDLEQLQEFAAVFSIAKRSGGNLSEVIRASAQLIRRKSETAEEIKTQTAGRKMERNIMLVMPFLFLVYIEVSNHGYFDSLYHNLQGICIMSGCLAVYLAAYVISERILEREAEV